MKTRTIKLEIPEGMRIGQFIENYRNYVIKEVGIPDLFYQPDEWLIEYLKMYEDFYENKKQTKSKKSKNKS